MKKVKMIIIIIVLLTSISSCNNSNNSISIEKDILNGLRPAVYMPDNEVTYNIEDRMRHWDVPAVSLVVIDNMQIAYSGAFGVMKKGDSSFVDSNTKLKST